MSDTDLGRYVPTGPLYKASIDDGLIALYCESEGDYHIPVQSLSWWEDDGLSNVWLNLRDGTTIRAAFEQSSAALDFEDQLVHLWGPPTLFASAARVEGSDIFIMAKPRFATIPLRSLSWWIIEDDAATVHLHVGESVVKVDLGSQAKTDDFVNQLTDAMHWEDM